MRVIAIGDVVGKSGRRAVKKLLPGLKKQRQSDLVIVNGENAAGGIGLTVDTARELLNFGVDVITSGNHIWVHKDILPYLNGNMPIVRPLNYPPGVPGRGYIVAGKALVVNLMGRTFMHNVLDCPFRAMDKILSEFEKKPPVIIVDFHAEATSEKMAMGKYLDGRVSAVLGTHTHVTTADERVLPKGTAYISDMGMTGPIDSVIGDNAEDVLNRFLTGINNRLTVAEGRVMFNGVLVDIDSTTGKASRIERIYQEVD